MNALLPIGLIAGAFVLSQSGKKPAPSKKAPHLSTDCEWICGDDPFKGLNVAQEIFKRKKEYDPIIEKYINSPDFGIDKITNEILLKTYFKHCKLKGSEISKDDSFTLRYLYSNTLVSTAFYLALSKKVTDAQLSMWLNVGFPEKLKELGLLTVGNTEVNVMKMRFASITDPVIDSVISKIFILAPEFKSISDELLATMMIIQFTQIVKTEHKEKCYKITSAQYADFSGLSGQVDNFYIDQFHRFRNASIKAKA